MAGDPTRGNPIDDSVPNPGKNRGAGNKAPGQEHGKTPGVGGGTQAGPGAHEADQEKEKQHKPKK